MREAFGGIMNLFIIAMFLVLLSSTFALIVNYTKAFKMKNSVISNFEKYEGNCRSDDTPCVEQIIKEADAMAYSPSVAINCPSGFDSVANRFCYKLESTNSRGVVYEVVTQVDIDFPFINRLMGLRVFQVSGKTRLIKTITT